MNNMEPDYFDEEEEEVEVTVEVEDDDFDVEHARESIGHMRERVRELRKERKTLKRDIKQRAAELDDADDEDLHDLQKEFRHLSKDLEEELKLLSEEISRASKRIGADVRRKMKNVTIRGLDAEVYGNFARMSKGLGTNIGDLVSGLMSTYLQGEDAPIVAIAGPGKRARRAVRVGLKPLRVTDMSELSIRNADLAQSGRRVSFLDIEELTFEDDVDFGTFETTVELIRDCGTVSFPDTFPKLLAYALCVNCEEVEFRPVVNATQLDVDFADDDGDEPAK